MLVVVVVVETAAGAILAVLELLSVVGRTGATAESVVELADCVTVTVAVVVYPDGLMLTRVTVVTDIAGVVVLVPIVVVLVDGVATAVDVPALTQMESAQVYPGIQQPLFELFGQDV